MKNPLNIIYEDADILVINKPAGIAVHGAQNIKEPTLTDWLLKKYPEIKDVGDPSTSSGQVNLRPGIVHRLDKDTSGVLIIAKNQKTFEYLKKQFQERKIKKTYLALVYGKPKQKQGRIELGIAQSKKDFRKRAAVGEKRGKIRPALTLYKVKNEFSSQGKNFALLEVEPQTGRTHQIRAHFKAIGHPIVCDKLYGARRAVKEKCPLGLKRQFLHALSLELTLPSASRAKFEADLPEDLDNALALLKNS